MSKEESKKDWVAELASLIDEAGLKVTFDIHRDSTKGCGSHCKKWADSDSEVLCASHTYGPVALKIEDIINGHLYDLTDEKRTQEQIEKLLTENEIEFTREHRLSPGHIVDFMVGGLAVEIKVKGQAVKILRQCEKYCEFDEVKALMLVTSRAMGFPRMINGKPCYYLSLSKGML